MKKILSIIALIVTMVSAVAVAPEAFAIDTYVCSGGIYAGKRVSSASECNDGTWTEEDTTVADIFVNVVNVITGIVGFIAILMIVVGGIMYATSTGDAPKVKKAKDTIVYGIIGLVIALLAFAIVNFVLANL